MSDDGSAMREWTGLLQRHRSRLERIARNLAAAHGVAEDAGQIIGDALEALLGKWSTVRSKARPATGACGHHGPACTGRAEFRVRGTFRKKGRWRKRSRLLCPGCRVETDDDRQCAYFTNIVKKLALEYARKKARRPELSLDDPDRPRPATDTDPGDVEAAVEDRLAAEALGRALQQLPDDAREILLLSHVWGLTPVELADHLGITKTAATSRVHRATARLRRLLPDWIWQRYTRKSGSPDPEGGESP